MKRRIRTWFNFEPGKEETFDQPSLAVPDMSLDIRTLYERYTRKGEPLPQELQSPRAQGYDLEDLPG